MWHRLVPLEGNIVHVSVSTDETSVAPNNTIDNLNVILLLTLYYAHKC